MRLWRRAFRGACPQIFLKVIIDVSRKMQGLCRRAKKDIKRHGCRFWSKLDEWNAMRSAV